ncbi:MAG: pullulanase-type alpha-1,6-glucosidase [Trueperaceae bacterium]|nr:pullulanase-type alpha-1,6-glucosidase [Trueperaceae bacterium]
MVKRFFVIGLYLLSFFSFAQALPEGIARVHYNRPDANYDGFQLHVWEDADEEVTWADGLDIAGTDDYGVYWDVKLKEGAERVGFIVHKGDLKDPEPDRFLVISQHGREIWLVSGSEDILTSPPLAPPAANIARIHYFRPDAAYEGFKLHVWEDADEEVSWQDGLEQTGSTGYGVYWDVRLKDNAQKLGFIIHKGDEKDPGPDMFLELGTGNEVWLLSGSTTLYSQKPEIQQAGSGDLRKAQAYWVLPDLIAWKLGTVIPGTEFWLHSSQEAGLELSPEGIRGGEKLELFLDEAGLPAEVLAKFPHLAAYSALRIGDTIPELADQKLAQVPELLREQLAVAMTHSGQVLDATGLQLPGVLDALYADTAQSENLGLNWQADTPTLKVWAPTAQTVRLRRFVSPGDAPLEVLDMTLNPESGVWSIMGGPEWKGSYYLFEVTVFAPSTGKIETNLVTDPYSLALSLNSTHSQFIDLEDESLKPAGWNNLLKVGLEAPEDAVIYEMHLRDFSANDPSVATEQQGTYLAFSDKSSNGMKHLEALANAGLSHLHLLPSFDIATINEDKTSWKTPEIREPVAPTSPEPQAAINTIRDEDAFNWGYDPYHYTVPEGSYAVNPDLRTLEFREMVQSLADIGLKVALDVVYNHTNSSGQNDKSVLDKIVPGYYHRLNKDGFVETSTCCQNTATEHAMMEKLMIDSVLVWVKSYKIDAFRFDLMGHHMVSNMQHLRAALDTLTLEKDGVDGKGIYLYGEGWNFGEVANNARGQNATQFNLAGTGIGTYSDRLRDAVRGGGPFDNGPDLISKQGFASGAYWLANERVTLSEAEQKARLLLEADQIRVGLAGNLADFRFEDRFGTIVSGEEVDYNGSPAGYTADPQEQIVYISKHDNQTFWDFSQYKLPADLPISDRVRLHNLGLDIVMLSQGVPFFQAGDDMLRSKSFDRNSYNSGDWFNRLDFSYESNNFGVGLPLASENQSNWNFMRPFLSNQNLYPDHQDILDAVEHFQMMLSIRQSSDLFRLETAEAIEARLHFYNTGPEQIPGVIVMGLADDLAGLPDLDPNAEMLLVVFNASPKRQTLKIPELAGLDMWLLPPLKAQSDDPVSTSAHYAFNNSISVPAFSTAIFYQPQP